MSRTAIGVYIITLCSAFGAIQAAEVVAPASPTGDAPFGGLRLRGINVREVKEMADADYAKIAGWGCNSIRLQIHADTDVPQRKALGLVTSEFPLKLSEKAFDEIKRNLDLAHKHNLAVVISMQNSPGKHSGKLWQDFRYRDVLISLWKELARRYGSHPAVVGYDLLNEPNAARGGR